MLLNAASDVAVGALRAVRDAVRSLATQDAAQSKENDHADLEADVRSAGVLRADALDVAARLLNGRQVPARLQGAGLGLMWSLGQTPADPVRAIRAAAVPERIGDYLSGLFALARDEAVAEPGVIEAVDTFLVELADRDFLVALPALREAFSAFSPRERDRLAHTILELHGSTDPRTLQSGLGDVSAELLARAAAAQARARELLAAAGLDDSTQLGNAASGMEPSVQSRGQK
ncbi:MAG: DUF5682 family protein [Galactobacter sp.]